MAALLSWLPNLLRRRKREALLAAAQSWPRTSAQMLKSVVVARDPLADGGTTFQDSQVESAFFFVLNGSYFGGHLRSTPVSDSEGFRMLRAVPEDLAVRVRYNPANPDETLTMPADNPDFPFTIWPN